MRRPGSENRAVTSPSPQNAQNGDRPPRASRPAHRPRALPGYATSPAPPVLSPLAMTCRAARPRVEVVLRGQLASDSISIVARVPGHARDVFAWPQIGLGRAMAVEAPAHGQRRELGHLRHLVDAPVAAYAA